MKNNYGRKAAFFKPTIYMHDLIDKVQRAEGTDDLLRGIAGAVIYDEGTISSCENNEAGQHLPRSKLISRAS